ncbi:MAG TPA: hypothetical protein VGK02_04045 [Candidatus Aquicultor sp.]|jgi:hypothetical protein
MSNISINLYHLYPDAMNLYGDYGNVLALVKRCEWRGFDVVVTHVKQGDSVDFNAADIILMGGGQDRSQQVIAHDLKQRECALKEAIEQGVCALTVCGAYQLFGHYFRTKEGLELPGIGVFDVHTEGSDDRMIGNTLIDCYSFMTPVDRALLFRGSKLRKLELVGFENHSGKTYLQEDVTPFGKVIKGYGNDGASQHEGCRYKNAFGTYLHGPLLPKNPWFADYLIVLALRRKYGENIEVIELDNSMEAAAFYGAKKRALTAKTTHI